MKTMTIDGVEYAEEPETSPHQCVGCAFRYKKSCTGADTHIQHAEIVFGGDCCDRQVIYIRADKAREKALTKLTETSQELGLYDEKRYTQDKLDAAVAAERERCAQVCQQVAEENTDQDSYHWSGCMDCKEAIETLNVEPTGCRSQSGAARS